MNNGKNATTADRLQEIMRTRNLKQVDILRLCQPYCKKFGIKLQKTALSQYVSGKFVPSQFKLTILAMALNVSESWLLGYDVPMSRDNKKSPSTVDEDEELLLNLFRTLPDDKKKLAIEMIRVALQA
ncbi:MAG: hypothetical protein ACI4IK_01420 [Eubacterium sp.]